MTKMYMPALLTLKKIQFSSSKSFVVYQEYDVDGHLLLAIKSLYS